MKKDFETEIRELKTNFKDLGFKPNSYEKMAEQRIKALQMDSNSKDSDMK